MNETESLLLTLLLHQSEAGSDEEDEEEEFKWTCPWIAAAIVAGTG